MSANIFKLYCTDLHMLTECVVHRHYFATEAAARAIPAFLAKQGVVPDRAVVYAVSLSTGVGALQSVLLDTLNHQNVTLSDALAVWCHDRGWQEWVQNEALPEVDPFKTWLVSHCASFSNGGLQERDKEKHLADWLADIEQHLDTVTPETLESNYLAVREHESASETIAAYLKRCQHSDKTTSPSDALLKAVDAVTARFSAMSEAEFEKKLAAVRKNGGVFTDLVADGFVPAGWDGVKTSDREYHYILCHPCDFSTPSHWRKTTYVCTESSLHALLNSSEFIEEHAPFFREGKSLSYMLSAHPRYKNEKIALKRVSVSYLCKSGEKLSQVWFLLPINVF